MSAIFDLALGWSIIVLWAIAAGVCCVFILAIGYRLAQIRDDRRRRQQRQGYIYPPFRNG